MKICVYGIGAIGGWIATRMLATDHQLSCVDTPDVVAAIRRDGLCLQSAEGEEIYKLTVADTPAALGIQDLVIVAVRSMDLAVVAQAMQPLLGEHTVVVTLCNGIPWWYFSESTKHSEPNHLQAIDPAGIIRDSFGFERAIGCIVYPSLQSPGPGIIEHQFGTRFTLGEPGGKVSERLKAVAEAFTDAGLNAVAVKDIRQKLWLRLMASTSYSLVSVRVKRELGVLFDNYNYRREIVDIMKDIVAVAKAMGVSPTMRPKELLDMSVLLGGQKTLMQQDIAAGRPAELQALAVAIQELGARCGVATPALDKATAAAIEEATLAGCYTPPQ